MSMMEIKTADGSIYYVGYDPEYGVPEKETTEYKIVRSLERQEEERMRGERYSLLHFRDREIGI